VKDKRTILIVEDNAMNLELAVDLLEAAGFRVLTATTAEAALQLARSAYPDLVLMDISLPGMDGLAATQALKKDPATQHLPIVALTAHAMRGDADKALAAGCGGYLTKPIDTRDFCRQVDSFLKSLRNQPTAGPIRPWRNHEKSNHESESY
jgi:CheY-like chemotaxis protein